MFTNIRSCGRIICMKKADFYLIIAILLFGIIGLIFFNGFKEQGSVVTVYVNGQIHGSYNLNDDSEIEIIDNDNICNVIAISKGQVCMKYANCPDGICVNQGYIKNNNESICCAPNKVLVVVSSDIEGEFDAITR